MLASFSDLLNFRARLAGDVFPVSDLLFDPENFELAYLMVDVGGWFESSHLFIAASLMGEIDTAKAEIACNATEDDLRLAPHWSGEEDGFGSVLSALPPLVVGPFGATHAPLAMAAELAPPPSDDDEETDPRATSALARYDRATEWIDAEVFVSDGEAGRLASLLYDPDTNRVTHLVVDNEKVLSGKLLVVPVQTLRHRATGGHLVLDMNREALDGAPQIDEVDRLDRHWMPGVHAYFVPPM